jgi:hypothetical protein
MVGVFPKQINRFVGLNASSFQPWCNPGEIKSLFIWLAISKPYQQTWVHLQL